MGLRGAIGSLSTGTYDVQRHDTGSYSQGRYTAGAASTISIVASVQPYTGRKLQDLPEGVHGDEIKLVITVTELRGRMPGTHGEPDRVVIDGESWRVVDVEHWQSFGEEHYECLVAREIAGA